MFKEWTSARIGLKRCGDAISTRDLLDFRMAQASARDAVNSRWDSEKTQADLAALGERSLIVYTQTQQRNEFLRRPDLGRRLSEESISVIPRFGADIIYIVS